MVDGRHGESGINVHKHLVNRVMICQHQIHVYAEQDLVTIRVRKMAVPYVMALALWLRIVQ